MKKGDLYIGLVALFIMILLGVGYFIYVNQMGSARYVNVYVNNKMVKSVKISSNTEAEFTVLTDNGKFIEVLEGVHTDTEYDYNIIKVYNKGFEVIDADCPNKDDVRQGFVKMPGLSVVCVPHHLKVVIEGENAVPDFDAKT